MAMAMATNTSQELWRHPSPRGTPMYRFLEAVNAKHGLGLTDYDGLYRWSVENVATFWEDVWLFVGVTAAKTYDCVLPTTALFPRPDFFAGARLNFAENLLYPTGVDVDPAAPALITVTEAWATTTPPTLPIVTTSWAELREAVRRCAARLRDVGLQPGDIVAGFVGNHAEAMVTMLATASIGAVWTSISPDNGVSAVLDRLLRVAPKVLFADSATIYNGKVWSSMAKTQQIADALAGSLQAVVVIAAHDPSARDGELSLDALRAKVALVELYEDFLARAPAADPGTPPQFAQLPPSHPLYILYSSGTTGLPKAIVHTALGTLLQHKKELVLHCSLGPQSRMLYYTTTSWMMWHWSVSGLATGASLVLFTGSPFRPLGHLSLPRLLAQLRVTHFGTSAAYLVALEANDVRIPEDIDLSALEAIYSTASPLPPSTFAYVYDIFPPRVHLASITGGTDIISLFGAPCPLLPVAAGAVQCAGLGMAVAVADSASPPDAPRLVAAGEEGDLVCTQPFPSQPLTFYDGDDKYRAAYFERFPGWWHHGDFVRLEGQALVMLGRSDGVLKPSGVRFGSAEIYNILTRFFANEIEDALCVGRRRPQDADETVCLFVAMVGGSGATPAVFDDTMRSRIKTVIRRELSPRHVPGIIEECGGGIPHTTNGKKIEVAVKQVLSGMDVKTNASVANPESIDWFRAWAKAHS